MTFNQVAQNSNSGILNVDCFSELIGDGFCDDEVNDFLCQFDGEDCCGDW